MSLCVTAVSDPAGIGTGLAISLTWHGPTVRSADLAMSLCVTAVSDPAVSVPHPHAGNADNQARLARTAREPNEKQ